MKKAIFLFVTAMIILTSCSKNANEDIVSNFGEGVFEFSDASLFAGYSITLNDEGYAVAAGKNSIQLVQLDSKMDIEFSKKFRAKSKNDVLHIENTSDGLLIGGTVAGSSPGKSNSHIIKTDIEGESQWMRNYGVYKDEKLNGLQSMDNDNIVYVGTEKNGEGDATNIKVQLLDNEGGTKQEVSLDKMRYDQAWGVAEQKDGDFGVLYSYADNKTRHFMGLVNYDAEGNELWNSTFEDITSTSPGYSIIATNRNGYLVGASVYKSDEESTDIQLTKISRKGKKLWSVTFGGPMSENVHEIIQTRDKEYIVLGSTESYGYGNKDIYLVKIGKYGDVIWSRTFGGSMTDIGYDIMQLKNDGFVISGQSDRSMVVFRTDAEGRPE